LWHLWRTWSERSHRAIRLTAEQYWILRTIGRDIEKSVSELAVLRGVTPSAMTIATRRMEESGWITRTRPAHNQRLVVIRLSEDGHQQWIKLRAERRLVLQEMMRTLSDEEQAILNHLLRRMQNLD